MTLIQAEANRLNLRRFAKAAWPQVDPAPLVWSWHLDALCDHLSWVSTGDIRFLIVNMPPRTSKSKVTSVIFPVWDWLQDPALQFLTASYALQLSARDALASRRLIESPWFQGQWGRRFRFSWDEKLKRQYSNDKGGRRIAIATGSATTGEGGNRLIIDDPHNATEIESEAIRKGTHDWWDHAMVNRMNQPEKDAWIINGQRTGSDDLFGHIEETTDMRQVVKLVLPNEFEPARRCITYSPKTGKVLFKDPRKKAGDLLCPARIGPETTKRYKRSMGEKYPPQFQQDPRGSGGKILKRDAWRMWEEEPPECHAIFTVYDTAFEPDEVNDYSARTHWGLFWHSELMTNESGETARGKRRLCAFLLGRWKGKPGYSDLRDEVLTHWRKTKPDNVLVEKKATGIVLCQDLSKLNVRGLRKISLAHGKYSIDKVERAHLASPMLDDGRVYYPDREWAREVIQECADFPEAKHDDIVDTVTMALMWLRRHVETGDWEESESDGTVRLFKRVRSLYG